MSEARSPDAIEIVRQDARWDATEADWDAMAARALAAVDAALEPDRRGEVALLLADDAALQALNARWRGKNKPTNVLSFPAPRGGSMLGDIALSYDTLAQEAAEKHISLQDHAMHLIVHGLLHLHGYDHQDDAEAEEMEALERRILAGFGIADPYAEDAA
ncbi:MAG TPA: rRNA maturation RNase YbeY [Paracoccaceae bacterium]|nr:rRNA maturation RNase YbeY [Paracoccaceae bacterium]